jgi:hypothetical protein
VARPLRARTPGLQLDEGAKRIELQRATVCAVGPFPIIPRLMIYRRCRAAALSRLAAGFTVSMSKLRCSTGRSLHGGFPASP